MTKASEHKRHNEEQGEQQSGKKQKVLEANASLIAQLEDLNSRLEAFNTSAFVDFLKAHQDDALVKSEAATRLVSLLQKAKSTSALLKEPTRRPRATLSLRDVTIPSESDAGFAAMPLWHQQLSSTNSTMLFAFATLLGEVEDAENGHLERMVDAFADELDQIRQGEDLGPNKLELLIDSLKLAPKPSYKQ